VGEFIRRFMLHVLPDGQEALSLGVPFGEWFAEVTIYALASRLSAS
jgi:hypothetical protein